MSLAGSVRSLLSARSSSYSRSKSPRKRSQPTRWSSAENIVHGLETVIEGPGTRYMPETELEMGKIKIQTTMDAREDT
ncbi:hypothetical protein MMC08_008486 [Hypocenomyce scalaris]|nr:hypothetical protein [Hypocenomyce scalaris]